MTMAQFFRAAPRGMLISVVIAFALLNGLGVWQLQRMHWKEGMIADMARTEAMAPLPAQAILAQAKPAWRSAVLPPCNVDPKHLIYMHSEVEGQPGYRVLTACPLHGQSDILVDLGFVTQPFGTLDFFGFTPIGRLRPFEKAGMVTPVNRPADNDWYWRSAKDMGPALHAPLRNDYFLVVDLSASHFSLPGLQQGPLNPQVAVPPDRHLEYALTWFALGWVMLGMFGAFVWQKARVP